MKYYIEVQVLGSDKLIHRWISADNPDAALEELCPYLDQKYGNDYRIKRCVKEDGRGDFALL